MHLSDDGRRQAGALAERLGGVRLDAVYSSPLDRALETAEPIARAQRLRVRRRDDLGEVHYGGIEGKSLKVLVKTKMWRRLVAWPSDVRFPNGESLRETQARAVAAIEALRAAHPGGAIAVVSHGDWIRLSLAHYMGVHIDLYRRVQVDPASVSALQFHEFGVQVRLLNDTGDLGRLRPAKVKR